MSIIKKNLKTIKDDIYMENLKKELLLIIDSLNNCVQDINVINPEREITFMYNDKKYKLVLSVPRK